MESGVICLNDSLLSFLDIGVCLGRCLEIDRYFFLRKIHDCGSTPSASAAHAMNMF